MQTGWQCPKCEVVHAPFVVRCDCSKSTPKATSIEDVVKQLDAIQKAEGDAKRNDPPKRERLPSVPHMSPRMT